jgi:hypothetical protein
MRGLRGAQADEASEEESGRLSRLFGPKPFAVALVLSLVGLLVGGAVPILGSVGRFLGIAAAGFCLAFVDADRRYAEAGLAGALTAGLGFVLNVLGTAMLPVVADYVVEIAGVGATFGLLAGVVGHYFGRDLRAGLARDL